MGCHGTWCYLTEPAVQTLHDLLRLQTSAVVEMGARCRVLVNVHCVTLQQRGLLALDGPYNHAESKRGNAVMLTHSILLWVRNSEEGGTACRPAAALHPPAVVVHQYHPPACLVQVSADVETLGHAGTCTQDLLVMPQHLRVHDRHMCQNMWHTFASLN